MYCKECGKVYENKNGEYCLSCGVKKGNGNKFCYNCGEEKKSVNQDICLSCGIEFKKTNAYNSNVNSEESEKTRLVAILLWICVGGFGAHQYYVGNSKRGTLMLILSVCGIITFGITTLVSCIMAWIDLFAILSGTFVDSENKKLLRWS